MSILSSSVSMYTSEYLYDSLLVVLVIVFQFAFSLFMSVCLKISM